MAIENISQTQAATSYGYNNPFGKTNQIQQSNQNSIFTSPEPSPQFGKSGLAIYDTNFFSTGGTVTVADQNTEKETTSKLPDENNEDLGFMGGLGRMGAAPLKYSWELLKSGGKFAWNTIKGATKATLGTAWSLITLHPVDALENFFGGIWDVIKSPFVLCWDVLKDTYNCVTDVLGGAGNVLSGTWSGIKDFFNGVFS